MATPSSGRCTSGSRARTPTAPSATWSRRPVWNLFAGASRARFRAELAVDDASWLRGRGWALAQAVMALPYYWDTNPGMVRQASHALAQVLADRSPG